MTHLTATQEWNWDQVLKEAVGHFSKQLAELEAAYIDLPQCDIKIVLSLLQERFDLIVRIARLRVEGNSIRDGEESCFTLVRGMIVIIGNSKTLTLTQASAIRALHAVAQAQPYPVLSIARFVADLAEQVVLGREPIERLKDELFKLIRDKHELLDSIGKVVADECQARHEFSLKANSRVLAYGNSILLDRVFAALTIPLSITLVDCSEEDRIELEYSLRQANTKHSVVMASLNEAETMLEAKQADLFLLGIEAMGRHENALSVIVSKAAARLCRLAETKVPILAIGGRHKIWPECLFVEHSNDNLQSCATLHERIEPKEGMWWIATEANQIMSPRECVDLYEQYFSARTKAYAPTDPRVVKEPLLQNSSPRTTALNIPDRSPDQLPNEAEHDRGVNTERKTENLEQRTIAGQATTFGAPVLDLNAMVGILAPRRNTAKVRFATQDAKINGIIALRKAGYAIDVYGNGIYGIVSSKQLEALKRAEIPYEPVD